MERSDQDLIRFREENIDCLSRLYRSILTESWNCIPKVKFEVFITIISKLLLDKPEKTIYPKPILHEDWLDQEAESLLTGEESDNDEPLVP